MFEVLRNVMQKMKELSFLFKKLYVAGLVGLSVVL